MVGLLYAMRGSKYISIYNLFKAVGTRGVVILFDKMTIKKCQRREIMKTQPLKRIRQFLLGAACKRENYIWSPFDNHRRLNKKNWQIIQKVRPIANVNTYGLKFQCANQRMRTNYSH